MQVILFDNIDRIGMKGDVVNVAKGFYRNFLGPREMAIEASPANMKRLDAKRRKLRSEADKQRQEAEGFAKELATAKVSFTMKSSDGEKLFGSVHVHEIYDQLVAQGFNLERRQILLSEPIKTTGIHTVKIKLVGQVDASVKVTILPEKEAEAPKPEAAPAQASSAEPAAPAEELPQA
jgi:large subunit ribosomal protein L9